MKRQIYFLLIFLFAGIATLYSQHIPQGHTHGTTQQGACWGYAVGRAFNRGWDDQRCAINTITFRQVDEKYFQWHGAPFNYSELQVHDIVAWGGKGSQHVAYVTNITNGITLADRRNTGGVERYPLTLEFLISDQNHEDPTGYFRLKKEWSITARNDVDGNYNVGKVGIYGHGWAGQYDSGQQQTSLSGKVI